MSTKYKFVGCSDIFTRGIYKTILLDSIRHPQQSQGLKIHA